MNLSLKMKRLATVVSALLACMVAVAQNINLNFSGASLADVLHAMEEQTEYSFIYETSDLNKAAKVSIQAQNRSLTSVLNEIIKAPLSYEMKGKIVIISATKQEPKPESKDIRVSGTVLDAKNHEPLVGLMVLIKGTTIGTTTDLDGHFSLNVPSKESVLVFDYIGFKQEEATVGSRTKFNIVMHEELSELDEVVVVGYGTQKRLTVVGAVDGVAPKQLQQGTTRSLSNNLAGQLAGVIAVQRTGEPGKDNSDFWIRGISTFSGSSSPLVLVDGVERSLNDMDPAEIESFSILKDAAASAVYGVRGANGVIIINTKRGEVGAPKVSVRYEAAMSEPTKLPSFIGAADFMEVMNGIASDSGFTILPYTDKQIKLTRSQYDPDLYPDVDWIDAITNDYAYNQRVNVNVNGGSPVLRYNITTSIFNENGIMATDKNQSWDGKTALTRYNIRSNVDVDITKTTLLKINIGGYIQKQNTCNHDIEDLFNIAFNTPPDVHPTIYSNGLIAIKDGNQNPWASATQKGFKRISKSKIESQATLEQDFRFITPGLKARVTFAFDSSNQSTVTRGKTPDLYNVAKSRDDDGNLIMNIYSYGQEFLSHSSSGTYGAQSTYFETALTYNRDFRKHYLDFMLLYNQRSYDVGDVLPFRDQGFAGRFSYSYDRRYVAEFNFGYNGSENFAKGHRFGFFPSVALGWLASEEPWMQPIKQIISKLKFRGSYGIVGNDDIQGRRFAYITTLGTNDGYSWGAGGSGGHHTVGNDAHTGRWEGNQGVADLTWEKSAKLDLGFELGLWHCFNLQADYFYERRSNIFMQRNTIPGSAGFINAPYANYGIVDNHGVDLSLEFNKQFGEDWFLSMKGTFTYAHNTIIEKDEAPSVIGTYRSFTGQSVSTLYGLTAIGLFTDDDFVNVETGELKEGIPAQSYGKVRPGDIRYKDMNKDNIINDEDKGPIGGTETPEIIFGIGASVRWKNLDLSAFFQGAGSTYRVIGSDLFLPGSGSGVLGNIHTNYTDSWSVDNPRQDVFYPRFTYGTSQNNKQASTWWKKDMSFVRLKTLEVGYSFKKFRIFLSGNNLFCISAFKLWDPEVGANDGLIYPTMRTWSIGATVNF